ncbi:hypothetical protein FRC09_016918 [Ceratobasidium sp. 395]|nr:hypothetical protein FRC09_016918 [Ceratobasidium sp. 395]
MKKPGNLVATNFDASHLAKAPYNNVPNPMSEYPNRQILFAVPVGGNLRGRVDLMPGSTNGLSGIHRCAGHHFYEGWEDNEFEPQAVSETCCFSNCTGEVDDDLPSYGMVLDEEDEVQMRAAVEASIVSFQREQRPDESSTSVSAGARAAPAALLRSSHDSRSEISNRQTPGLVELSHAPALVAPPANNAIPEPVPSQVFVNNLEPVTDFFDRLEAACPVPANNNDKLKFSYSDGTVQQAASVLVHFIQHFVASHLGMPPPIFDLEQSWHEVVQIQPSTVAGFLSQGHQRWSLSPAVGSGVMVPIMNAAMEQIFSDRAYFRHRYVARRDATEPAVASVDRVEWYILRTATSIFTVTTNSYRFWAIAAC